MATYELKGSDNISKKLEEIARKMGGGEVAVGFMEGATYPDGTPVAAVAYWNEFGKEHQPPRPYFRRMIAAESPNWPAQLAAAAKAADYDSEKALALMGEAIKGELQESINELVSPPLAQSTIDRKGFDKPLIETAHLLKSVAYEVKK